MRAKVLAFRCPLQCLYVNLEKTLFLESADPYTGLDDRHRGNCRVQFRLQVERLVDVVAEDLLGQMSDRHQYHAKARLPQNKNCFQVYFEGFVLLDGILYVHFSA